MKRIRVILATSLLYCLASGIAWAPCAVGESSVPASGITSPGSTLLKVQVTHAVFEYPEGDRTYKRAPAVEAALIRQIDKVRAELPAWRGLPHLAPGAGAGARP